MSSYKPLPTLITANVDDDYITLQLTDGRIIKVPLSWFPRVACASSKDRQDFEILGGRGIAWFCLDEDLTIEQVLKGQGSSESEASFERWRLQYIQGILPRPFDFLPMDVFEKS